ncbi:1,9-bis(guanidino)-5-aza-nonane synthase [Sphingosinithalassobacter portus]|uniref:1,9-bis(guanidino)-5-aza-nonane synthase n=1 Tax=Stakelama portus TaxID=2676234 RepID=UPI000D6DC9A1|nr:deoxyhypusine synthase [Sphingosinithalassobacter portus]
MTDTLTKTAAANAPINDTRKAELLSSTVEHIDIRSFDARPIIDSMKKMSFTSRDLANATGIYNQMLSDPDCTVCLVIAGSTSAGGCMDLYAELVRSNMVDVIVATGASIVDMDFFEGLGHKHYQALEIPDDDTLRSLYIDRIYDTYIDEEQLQDCDHTINKIAESLDPKPYSSRAFIREMGKYLVEHGKKDNSLVKLAYEHDVPIFCPAFVDSSAGFGLVKHQVDAAKEGRPYMVLDAIADFRELTQIKIEAGTTGLLMIGGGVPKNFIQDTVVCAEILGHEDVEVHKYAVQITVADVRDGACSSSTLQEAASWGKVNTGIEQMVFAEAGSVMPLLASDAYHRGHWKDRAKRAWAKLFA